MKDWNCKYGTLSLAWGMWVVGVTVSPEHPRDASRIVALHLGPLSLATRFIPEQPLGHD